MVTRLNKGLVSLVLALCFLTSGFGLAAANGTPVKIFLDYLPEISNYGPKDATGVAVVSIGEAWVELTAERLPPLTNQLYEAWLVQADTNDMISLGKFNADTNGQVNYRATFDNLPEADYRYFIITVEPDPDPDLAADARHTIAGVWPNAELQVVSGTATPLPQPGVTPVPAAPNRLPVTGNTSFNFLELAPWLVVFGGVLLVWGTVTFLIGSMNHRR